MHELSFLKEKYKKEGFIPETNLHYFSLEEVHFYSVHAVITSQIGKQIKAEKNNS